MINPNGTLTFIDGGVQNNKWYAETACGEFAFSDKQGLYQWHKGQRIDYSGGDRQGSSNGQMWVTGKGLDPTKPGLPAYLGFVYALSPRRVN